MATLPRPPPPKQAGDGTRRAYALRAKLRGMAVSARVAGCGSHVVMGGEHVEIIVREHGAHWRGVLTCGRVHSCPACAVRKGARLAGGLARVMARDLAAWGSRGNCEWRMVTLTVPHQPGEALRAVSLRLVQAWRRTRSTRAVRDIFAARVTATCRAREATYGAHGWHPHIHLVMRGTPWTAAERETLARAWCAALGVDWYAEGAWCPVYAEGAASDLDGVRLPALVGVAGQNGLSDAATFAVNWSKALASAAGASAYVAKMGLEVAGAALDTKSGKGRSPWQLAREAVARARGARARSRAKRARALWQEYQEASRGRRLLECDERLAAMLADETPSESERACYQLPKEVLYQCRKLERGGELDALYRPLAAAMRGGEDGLWTEVRAGAERLRAMGAAPYPTGPPVRFARVAPVSAARVA